MSAAISLKHGNEYPYDADDDYENAPPVKDWAHAAARGVVADLRDRRGIKGGFEMIEEETRKEIVDALAEIIRLAHLTHRGELTLT